MTDIVKIVATEAGKKLRGLVISSGFGIDSIAFRRGEVVEPQRDKAEKLFERGQAEPCPESEIKLSPSSYDDEEE